MLASLLPKHAHIEHHMGTAHNKGLGECSLCLYDTLEGQNTRVHSLSLDPGPHFCFFIYGPQRLWLSKNAMMGF